MCCIYEYRIRIYQFAFHALQQYLLKYLLEQISPFESSFVILAKGTEVWNFIIEVQAKEPSVCNIDFDFFDGLPHASDSIQVLNQDNLK